MYGNPYYQPYDGYDEYLEHFGVKGMKWGIRRYQNANGSLTAAGKQKLKKYKESEYQRVNNLRGIAIERYNREATKRKNKGKVDPSRQEAYNKRLIDTYEKELNVIKKMKYKDMQSDKQAAAKMWLASTAGAAVLATAVYTIMPASYTLLLPMAAMDAASSDAKTRNRMKRYKD